MALSNSSLFAPSLIAALLLIPLPDPLPKGPTPDEEEPAPAPDADPDDTEANEAEPEEEEEEGNWWEEEERVFRHFMGVPGKLKGFWQRVMERRSSNRSWISLAMPGTCWDTWLSDSVRS